jgi:hypothetical protein
MRVTAILLASVLSLGAAREDAGPPVPPPEASQFDFLVGAWNIDVEPNLPGIPARVKGRWTAQKSADGFMVVDEGGQTVYLGETYRVYNPSAKRWEFRYVEPFSGTWHEGTAVKDGAEMHLTQKGRGGSITKIRYYDIRPERFSWSSQRSRDGGKTWARGARIEATRAN